MTQTCMYINLYKYRFITVFCFFVSMNDLYSVCFPFTLFYLFENEKGEMKLFLLLLLIVIIYKGIFFSDLYFISFESFG